MKKIVTMLILIVSLSGCAPKVDKEALWEELNIVFDEEKLILDNGALFDPLAAITESVGNVSFPEIGIDTSEEGSFEFVYTVTHEKYEDVSKEFVVTYTVNPELYLELVDEVVEFEINEVNNACDYVVSYIGELVCPEYLDTSIVGTYYYTYIVINKDESKTIEKQLEILVVDKRPVIEGATPEFKVTAGNNYNFDKITAKDYLGNALEVEVVGDWNSRKVGRYPLQYKVVDSEGRETVYDFTFVTVSKPSTGNSNNSNSGNNNTGSTNAGGSGNSNTGNSNTGNGGGGSETTYACPNAVYDKNLPCDAVITQALGEKQFYDGDYRQACWDYGNNLINSYSQPEGAYSFACSGISNNMAQEIGMAFGWNYR